jgi:hypothetical protein
VAELRKWLSRADGVLRPLNVKPPETVGEIFTYIPTAEGDPQLRGPAPRPPAIGDVIAVDMLRLDKTGAFVLRVITLDDAWKYCRVRVTHLRNEVTSGGNPEFSPAFAMESPASTWSTFGRQPIIIDFTSTDIQNRNIPANIAALRSGLTVVEYLQATGAVSYPLALSNACLATFNSATGKSWTMWNAGQMISTRFTVRGTLMHERLDLHPRLRIVSGKTRPAVPMPERNEDIPRLFLPTAGNVTADKIDDLLKNFSKQQVPGLHQKLRVVWQNSKNEEVLAVTWPVAFAP